MVTKRTALASSTKKPVDPDAWVSEKPKATDATEKPARLVVEIPPELHRQLKVKCALEGLKIKDVTRGLLESYVAGTRKSS